ncbi:MAG: ATP-binding protein [Ardenticatenaceae bacterium]|nr:ATP-binding protein [Ardenticatenaceae bacterium]
MALSNRERVGRVLEGVNVGLAPFVVREYRMVYRSDFMRTIDATLTTQAYELPRQAFDDVNTLIANLDVHNVLNLMLRNWREVFQDKLGHVGRSYVSELFNARNDWAHQKAFTNDEAYRVADTAVRLLKMVSAGEQAAQVEQIAHDLLRLRFQAEAQKAKQEAESQKTPETTTMAGLKPWREVVSPHPDVASGRYLQAEFAADLSQVVAGTAEREYQDPVEFFRRTYLTEGLLSMLVTGIQRLTSQSGDPVVQLQTAFGGGKTHSMLALYHLCSGNVRLSDFPGGERISQGIGQVDLPEANRAVLVGTALDPARPHAYPEVTVHTLWGELAYQLGGAEGYAIVAQADQKGVSPNSNTLTELLDNFGPCLIIIDEFVAYARNIYKVDGLPSGSFDSVTTFLQALTEAVRRAPDSMLLISLPESDIEVGGEAGKEALNRLSHIVGRIESVWKPVTATESFEIVRRRLFASDVEYAARDAVLQAFNNMYRHSAGEFPSGIAERDYYERMVSAYPIHPELFDRLYQDWSTLERFQRTRGVLRLMAGVIHQLWTRNDASLLIMPGTIPLAATPVRNELLRYLPDTWTAVFDKDVDGQESLPLQIDGDVPMLGRYAAARRVARTIFLGSAPSVAGQRVRGLEEIRVRLGCAQPGEPTAVFGDALRRMGSLLTYLYSDGSRYWYDTRPTVNRLARDRAQGFPGDEVTVEMIGRLKKVPKNREFAAFHIAPPDSGDVVDEARVRIVVLPPDAAYKRRNGESEAIKTAQSILESRGSGQRLYKNMLVFVAADDNGVEALETAVREFMAWRSIQKDEEPLNLDAQQRRQVKTSFDKADETVDLRLREAYSWLLTPIQPEPLGKIEFQANRISGDDNFYDRAARKLRQDGLLINEWSPDILRMELDRYIWGEGKGWTVGLKQLWEYLAQYCYLPRLFDQEVLLTAVRNGIRRIDAPMAYATGVSAEGYHTGLLYQAMGQIYFDDQSILVHPDHINLAPPPPPKPGTGPLPATQVGEPKPRIDTSTPATPEPQATTRYYGRVELNPQRVNREMGLIVEEVIERLTSLVGCEVEISLEISAKLPEGFDEATIRTVSENSRTLKFDHYEFEKD